MSKEEFRVINENSDTTALYEKLKKTLEVINKNSNKQKIECSITEILRALNDNPDESTLDEKLIGGLKKSENNLVWIDYLFILAVQNNFTNVVDSILDRKILDINSVYVDKTSCSDSFTFLSLAAAHGSTEVLIILLNRGASFNPEAYEGLDPLNLAVQSGHADIVKIILERLDKEDCSNYADIHQYWKDESLKYAALVGYMDIAKDLLNHGARADVLDRNGFDTPLHSAAYNRYTDMVMLLLKYVQNVNLIDKNSRTPLHCASEERTLLRLRSRLGIGPKGKPIYNDALSIEKSRVSAIDTLKALLDKGANPLLKDRDGKTPRDLAKNDSIKQLLEEAEVRQLSQQQATTKGIIAGSATAGLSVAVAAYLFVNGIIAVEAMSIALAVVAIAAVALAVGGVTYKALQPSSKVDGTQVPENPNREKDAAQLP